MEWRVKMLRRAQKEEEYQLKVKELFHRDILFAFNAFYYTLDVRRRPRHHRPFTTYWYQDLAILNIVRAIEEKEDLPGEKSRDMGASWAWIGVFCHYWLNPAGGADFLLGSRIADYVDKRGDMRTLFEKLRYLVYKLPPWLLPKGFKRQVHDNYMKLVNPQTGASITGESNNPNFGTGGRYAAVLLDEFPKWEGTDEAAWTSLGDATPSRQPVGTPFGAAGKHYEMVTDGLTKKITVHWSLHPHKGEGLCCAWPRPAGSPKQVDFLHWSRDNWKTRALTSPWYEKEVERRKSPKEISQELDIDYVGAGALVFEGEELSRIYELLHIERPILEVFSPKCEVPPPHLERVEQSSLRDLEDLVVIYGYPTFDSLEVLGVDVAEGKETGDYSVIKCMNRYTKSLTLSYFGRTNEVRLAHIIWAISEWICSFKKSPDQYPWFVIETIGPGLSTFDLCVEYGVCNLFMMPRYDTARDEISWTKGWRTNTASRNKGISAIREWLAEHSGWVDQRCLRELTTFVRNKKGKPEAKSSCHDDEVMAWMLTLMGDEHLPAIEYKTRSYTDPTERLREELFGKPIPLAKVPYHTLCLETIKQKQLEEV